MDDNEFDTDIDAIAGPPPWQAAIEAMTDDDLLAQINAHDPYDLEFVRRFRAMQAALRAANAHAKVGWGLVVYWHKRYVDRATAHYETTAALRVEKEARALDAEKLATLERINLDLLGNLRAAEASAEWAEAELAAIRAMIGGAK